MNVSSDLSLGCSHSAAVFALVGLLSVKVYCGVTRGYHTIEETEGPTGRVVEKRLLLGVC